MENKIKVAIIGAGHIAQVHCPIILRQPNVKMVGIADADLGRAKALSSQVNNCSCYQDAKEMMEKERPGLVHILTPPQNHAELSIMAMNQGCHVLVEKPMALSLSDASRMLSAADQNGVRLCVNHNKIYQGVVQRAMGLVSDGVIGDIVSVEARYNFDIRRYAEIIEEGAEWWHWAYQLNGGPLQDHIPHPASFVCEYITELKAVQSIGLNRGILPVDWDDEVRVIVLSDKVIGYISLSFGEKPDVIIFSIRGSKGFIQADLFNNILIIRTKNHLPRSIARGLSGFQLSSQFFKDSIRNIYHFISGKLDKTDGLDNLVSKFYKAIRENTELPVNSENSLRVVALTEQIWPKPIKVASKTVAKLTASEKIKPNILVTGASGFIGIHLIDRLLAEKSKIRALVRPNSIHLGRLKKREVEIFEGDLTDADTLQRACNGITTIFHAGASMNNDQREQDIITQKGTEKLVHAALINQVERFIHLSSLVVYELLQVNTTIIDEDSPFQFHPETMGPYTRAKIEAEKIVLRAHKDRGLGVTVIRPGIVIGPLGRIFFPHLGYRYQDSLSIIVGKGDHTLPLTYIENTVDGIFKASITEKSIGKAYNLVDDGNITAKQYLEKFIQTTKSNSKIISLPFYLPYLAIGIYEVAAKLNILKRGKTSRDQLKWKQARVKFESIKAKNELCWLPIVPLEEGLKRTFEWYHSRFVK